MNPALNKMIKTFKVKETDWMCRPERFHKDWLIWCETESRAASQRLLKDKDAVCLFLPETVKEEWSPEEEEEREREKGKRQSVKQQTTRVMKEGYALWAGGWRETEETRRDTERWRVRRKPAWEAAVRAAKEWKQQETDENGFTARLQLCRSSSGRRVWGLCRGRRRSPRAWRRWCRRNPRPPPRASGTSPLLIRCPHTGNRQGQLYISFLKGSTVDRRETEWPARDDAVTRDTHETSVTASSWETCLTRQHGVASWDGLTCCICKLMSSYSNLVQQIENSDTFPLKLIWMVLESCDHRTVIMFLKLIIRRTNNSAGSASLPATQGHLKHRKQL